MFESTTREAYAPRLCLFPPPADRESVDIYSRVSGTIRTAQAFDAALPESLYPGTDSDADEVEGEIPEGEDDESSRPTLRMLAADDQSVIETLPPPPGQE